MKKLVTGFAFVAMIWAVSASAQGILLNEIRIDHGGADTDEYVEVSGPAGASLSGYSVVVIGDGTPGCGTVEAAINLSAFSIQADGLFCLRYSGGTALLSGYDASQAGSFENGDNLTFFLVTGNTAAVGNDLDTNNDGTLDSTPWTLIVDQVALLEDAIPGCGTPDADDEAVYSTTTVGPDGAFVPGHVYRCGSNWVIGPFIGSGWPTGAQDTPGSANSFCPVPVEPSTWGSIKALYR